MSWTDEDAYAGPKVRRRHCYVCSAPGVTDDKIPMCERHKPALIEQKPAREIVSPADANPTWDDALKHYVDVNGRKTFLPVWRTGSWTVANE